MSFKITNATINDLDSNIKLKMEELDIVLKGGQERHTCYNYGGNLGFYKHNKVDFPVISVSVFLVGGGFKFKKLNQEEMRNLYMKFLNDKHKTCDYFLEIFEDFFIKRGISKVGFSFDPLRSNGDSSNNEITLIYSFGYNSFDDRKKYNYEKQIIISSV